MSRASGAVSVVIPTFNRAHLLPRALDSVMAQSFAPAEVFVVDDGSTDDTAKIVGRDYPSVHVLRQDNAGVSRARNRGILSSQYELIAFLDSDDTWEPAKLQRQVEAMERDPSAVLCHTDEIWFRRGRRVNPMKKHRKSGGRIFERCLPLCVISPSSVMVRRQLFDAVGLFNEELPACEDYDLWLRVTARFPVLYLEEPLVVKHGGHDDQLSNKFPAMDRFRIQALRDILSSGSLSEGESDAARRTLRQKVAIYAAGARKRGKHAEADAIESSYPS